jgi:hypothetical protein
MSIYSELQKTLPEAVRRRVQGISGYVDSLLAELEIESESVGILNTEDRNAIRSIAIIRALIEQLDNAIHFGRAAAEKATTLGFETIQIGSLKLGGDKQREAAEADALTELRNLVDRSGLEPYFSKSWKAMIHLLAKERPWRGEA